jgi:hypothetical protein
MHQSVLQARPPAIHLHEVTLASTSTGMVEKGEELQEASYMATMFRTVPKTARHLITNPKKARELLISGLVRLKSTISSRVKSYIVDPVQNMASSRRGALDRLRATTGTKSEEGIITILRTAPNLYSRVSGSEDHIRQISSDAYQNSVTGIISQANGILDGVVDLFGKKIKITSDGKPGQAARYRWHEDPISGASWPVHANAARMAYSTRARGDVKVPWELSRMTIAIRLGQAYTLTAVDAYKDGLQRIVADWIVQNPPGYGVNWACTMEAGIRAFNLLLAMGLVPSEELDNEFLVNFYASMNAHGTFIEHHLEYFGELTTNHLVGDLVGLLAIGIACPFFKESRRWLRIAVTGLEAEIRKQVYPDGVDFEASTAYHRLVTEMFLWSQMLCQDASVPLSSTFKARLRKMLEFESNTLKADDTMPQVGDNDSGRLIAFQQRPSIDHGYLLDAAAVYFGEARFKRNTSLPDFECLWMLGPDIVSSWEAIHAERPENGWVVYEYPGWAILRAGNNYCFFSCGNTGQNGTGGHGHNDKLAFELVLDGTTVLVDPGTYAYTGAPKWRNLFRSTRYHNTIRINGREQNPITGKLFSLQQVSKPGKISVQDGKTAYSVTGSLIYPGGIVHVRTVTIDKHASVAKIVDQFSTKIQGSSHHLDYNFQLAPGCRFVPVEQFIEREGKRFQLSGPSPDAFTLKKGYYSPGYLEIEPVDRIHMALDAMLPCRIELEIREIE